MELFDALLPLSLLIIAYVLLFQVVSTHVPSER
jgi:hypothetical protein